MTGHVGSAKFDAAAMIASGLCLVHCLAIPLVLLLVPTVGALIALPEEFHRWAVAIAIPTSAIAVLFGYRRHRALMPLSLAVPGLTLMAWGAFFTSNPMLEILLTVVGASVLAVGHWCNWQLADAL